MSRATILTGRLGLRHPVIQAPLAGGGDTPALVAAVAEAGALGFIGASYLTPGADRRDGARGPGPDRAPLRDQPLRPASGPRAAA